MAERFQNIERNEIFSIAAYLDPRFKKKAFSQTDAVKICRDRIVRQMENISQVEKRAAAPVSGNGTSADAKVKEKKETNSYLIWGMFDESVKDLTEHATEKSSAIIELRSYTDEVMIDRHEDPLDYWQKREPTYRRISKLAKKYLTIPATSVPCERVFSKAGELITDRRNRLSTTHTEQIIFLNANVNLKFN